MQGARSRQDLVRIQQLTAPFPTVWPTEGECTAALNEFSRLRLSHGLGMIDALIGSIAAARSATLLTFNAKHFRIIPNLATLEPYTR